MRMTYVLDTTLGVLDIAVVGLILAGAICAIACLVYVMRQMGTMWLAFRSLHDRLDEIEAALGAAKEDDKNDM